MTSRQRKALVVLFFAWPWLVRSAHQTAVRRFLDLDTED